MPAEERGASRRGSLDRDSVIRAAVEIADADGVASLSMRKVGEAVGVEAMSLYHHVANKDDLLDGMVELLYAEIDLPLDERDWKQAMRRRAHSAREVMRRHRWATALMESRRNPGPENLRHHDGVVGIFRRAGFSVEMSGHAYALVDSFIYGFAIQEATLPFDEGSGASDMARELLDDGVLDDYPHLVEFIRERALEETYDFGDEFEWGLERVLDAIERALDGGAA
jgi:AcrR family transcriptional regulator